MLTIKITTTLDSVAAWAVTPAAGPGRGGADRVLPDLASARIACARVACEKASPEFDPVSANTSGTASDKTAPSLSRSGGWDVVLLTFGGNLVYCTIIHFTLTTRPHPATRRNHCPIDQGASFQNPRKSATVQPKYHFILAGPLTNTKSCRFRTYEQVPPSCKTVFRYDPFQPPKPCAADPFVRWPCSPLSGTG